MNFRIKHTKHEKSKNRHFSLTLHRILSHRQKNIPEKVFSADFSSLFMHASQKAFLRLLH